MNERNLEIVLDALAENIRSLRVEIMLKDHRIESLEAENKELKKENKNA